MDVIWDDMRYLSAIPLETKNRPGFSVYSLRQEGVVKAAMQGAPCAQFVRRDSLFRMMSTAHPGVARTACVTLS